MNGDTSSTRNADSPIRQVMQKFKTHVPNRARNANSQPMGAGGGPTSHQTMIPTKTAFTRARKRVSPIELLN